MHCYPRRLEHKPYTVVVVDSALILIFLTGPYSISISWPVPAFTFHNTPTPIEEIPICHYYLNVSYTPQQKGESVVSVSAKYRQAC